MNTENERPITKRIEAMLAVEIRALQDYIANRRPQDLITAELAKTERVKLLFPIGDPTL